MLMNKLCLGTVQFGLQYGINNKIGKPSREAVFAMLDIAIDEGIPYIDTAVAYGDAEELLGAYGISGRNVKVISKLQPNLIDNDCENPIKMVENQVEESLERMRLDSMDSYLLHTPENFYNKDIIQGLKNCQRQGLIENIGVSIYETQHALDVVKSGLVDYIQIPYSVFDQRLANTDFFKLAQENQVRVFARSAFLQGLILMKEEEIPDKLAMAKVHLRELDKIIGKYEFTRLEAAFLFSYTNPNIDHIVFGVDNKEQLQDDLQTVKPKKIAQFMPCREELSQHFSGISKSIIFPSLWAKK